MMIPYQYNPDPGIRDIKRLSTIWRMDKPRTAAYYIQLASVYGICHRLSTQILLGVTLEHDFYFLN